MKKATKIARNIEKLLAGLLYLMFIAMGLSQVFDSSLTMWERFVALVFTAILASVFFLVVFGYPPHWPNRRRREDSASED